MAFNVLRAEGSALRLSLSIGAVLSVLLPTTYAQTAGGATLPDTVVTAGRTPQPLADLIADVSVLDRRAIEQSGATGLADVLARLPGLEISRNGGLGAATSVFLRGGNNNHTAVYLDGVRIDTQSASGGAPWEAIPLAMIDRIEVLRGPAGAVYGSDAVAGVVQIFTRRGEAGVAPMVALGVGNQGTVKAEAGVSGAQGAVDYALGVSRSLSDGFNARTVATQNPDRDGYRQSAGHARVGLQLNAAHRLEGSVLASDMNSGYDNSLGKDDRSLNRLRTAGLQWQARWSDTYLTRVSVTDSQSRYETRPSPYLTETQLRGYLFQNEWRLGAHLFTAALERREDALQNAPIDRARSQNALALGYGLRAGAHTLQANLRHDNDSEFGGKNTGSLAYGYALTPQWRATASVGTAFRAPTLYQRFSEYGLAGLRPEDSTNTELGLRWAQGGSQFSAVAYRNRLRNLIAFGAAGSCASAFGCYANTARAEYQGITLAGSHRLGGVQLHASVDFQDPTDRDTGRQLARRAKRHAKLAADTQAAGWTVGAELQAAGPRFDNAANTQVLGGYGVLNLYASTRLSRDLSLLARIDNLADKDYQLARTYATAGRLAFVQLKWTPQ